MNHSEFRQGAAAATGPGADDDLAYRLTQAERGAAEHGAPAEEQAQRGADRHTKAVRHERSLPHAALSDGRTYPVTFDIGPARQQVVQPQAAPPDNRVIQRLERLEHRADMAEANLSMLATALTEEAES